MFPPSAGFCKHPLRSWKNGAKLGPKKALPAAVLSQRCRGETFTHSVFEHRQCVLDFLGDEVAYVETLSYESEIVHMGDKAQQGSPEATDIRNQHRLGVTIELRPGELLDKFLQRPDPAGERYESVGAVEHQLLALM